MTTLAQLKAGSGLPGPRGNLELLRRFVDERNDPVVAQCLACIHPDTSNSPEEFAGMCGVVGTAARLRDKPQEAIGFLMGWSAHGSWRIREAAAMGIQEIAPGNVAMIVELLRPWAAAGPLERRALVAGLAEPALLSDPAANREILGLFASITDGFRHSDRLSEPDKVLRQALGYAWSVVVVHSGKEGKTAFEALLSLPGSHVAWIVRENLGKNRMAKFDADWTRKLSERAGRKPK